MIAFFSGIAGHYFRNAKVDFLGISMDEKRGMETWEEEPKESR